MAVRIGAEGITYLSGTGTPTTPTGGKIGNGTNGGNFNSVYSAVWNDYVDAIPVDNDVDIIPGYCYSFDGENYHKAQTYMDKTFIGIESDTYGQGIGFRDQKLLHVPVAGFVLAYVDKEYPVGTPLTTAADGKLTNILPADKAANPECIVATYWKKEDKEFITDGSKKVFVNGRTWVKVK